MIFAKLRDVNEAVDVVFKLDESTEACDLSDRSFNKVTNREAGINLAPRVTLKLLNTKTDSLIRLVDLENDCFGLFALLNDFARMIDLTGPTKVGNVNHTIDTIFKLNKRTVGGEIADLAFDRCTDWVT